MLPLLGARSVLSISLLQTSALGTPADASTLRVGATFSEGPPSRGMIAFTDRDGRLLLFERKRRKQSVAGAKDGVLPAWTADGVRLGRAQKAGRKKAAV